MTLSLTANGKAVFDAIKTFGSNPFTADELAKKMGKPSRMSVLNAVSQIEKAGALTKTKTTVENKNTKSGKSSVTKYTLTAEGAKATVEIKA